MTMEMKLFLVFSLTVLATSGLSLALPVVADEYVPDTYKVPANAVLNKRSLKALEVADQYPRNRLEKRLSLALPVVADEYVPDTYKVPANAVLNKRSLKALEVADQYPRNRLEKRLSLALRDVADEYPPDSPFNYTLLPNVLFKRSLKALQVADEYVPDFKKLAYS